MPQPAYKNYLTGYRRALEGIGIPADIVKEFGTHSARARGDTALFKAGANAELRRDIGRWATPLVERGYLRLQCRARVSFMKTFGL